MAFLCCSSRFVYFLLLLALLLLRAKCFFSPPGSRFCELPLFILFCLIIGSVCGERVGRFVELSCPRRGCAGPPFCLPLASSPRCGCKRRRRISACLVVVHRPPLPLFPVSLSREWISRVGEVLGRETGARICVLGPGYVNLLLPSLPLNTWFSLVWEHVCVLRAWKFKGNICMAFMRAQCSDVLLFVSTDSRGNAPQAKGKGRKDACVVFVY